MPVFRDEAFIKKAIDFKRELLKREVRPEKIVEIARDEAAFQGLKMIEVADLKLPLVMNAGDKVILDFGDHCVGHLHFALTGVEGCRIPDSPAKLRFSFGEFPLEIATKPEDYQGILGNGWLQYEDKSVVFVPYSTTLERRYSFRYLMIERIDNATVYPIALSDIFAEVTSAVKLSDAAPFTVEDKELQSIYDISLKTLRECEQDVFEDGPKRDCRLWIGDLRLQALTDYVTFRNVDLAKRCIYLFAGYRTEEKLVSRCVFPDSPPHSNNKAFADYSLFFISCLYDYMEACKDVGFLEELYPIALEQAQITATYFDTEKGVINLRPFIDWCPELDKEVAFLGVYVYTLKQLLALAEKLQKPQEWIAAEIKRASNVLLGYRDAESGLFLPRSKQLSWHSQVWVVLSGVLDAKEGASLLHKTQSADPEFVMHTPYMIHYYLEALYSCGLKDEVVAVIKKHWGKIVEYGFDCCPEIFNLDNQFDSPYGAPEINSACHAWSCTPAYWIFKLYK